MNLIMIKFYLQNKITLEIISNVLAVNKAEAIMLFAYKKMISEEDLIKIYNVI